MTLNRSRRPEAPGGILVRGSPVRKSLFRNSGVGALGIIAALGIPALLIHAGVINTSAARIITIAGVNGILAVSVYVVMGLTGILSLSQAAFMALGAYGCVFFAVDLGLPLPLSAVLSSLAVAALSCLLGLPALKLSGDYLALVTLGFGEIVRLLLGNLTALTGGSNGRHFEKSLAAGPVLSFLTITVALVIILVLLRIFLKSDPGRTLLMIREDEIAANSYGIPLFRYRLAAFVISAFIAGLGGCLYAVVTGFIEPGMASFTKSLDYLIYAVFGGLGSLTGAVTASYTLTFLPEILQEVFSGRGFMLFRILGESRIIIYALVLIIVMIYRPGGLIGQREFSFAWLAGRFFNLRRRDRRSPGDRRGYNERRMSEERRSSSDRRQNNSPRWDNERRSLPDRRRLSDRRRGPERRQGNSDNRKDPIDRRQSPGDRRRQDDDRRQNRDDRDLPLRNLPPGPDAGLPPRDLPPQKDGGDGPGGQ